MIRVKANKKYNRGFIQKILNDIGLSGKEFRFSPDKTKEISIIRIFTSNEKILVVLSAAGKETRNAWISQPSLMMMKYKDFDGRKFLYNLSKFAKDTPRNIFDIKCMKTYGFIFVGENTLGDIKITDIQKFSNFDEWLYNYDKINERSKQVKNNIINIEKNDNLIEITNGRTDGASRGSLFMLIIGLKNLCDKIKVYTKESHTLGKEFMQYMRNIGVEFVVSEDELDKLISKNDIKDDSSRPFQERCSRNAIKRVVHRYCELTNEENSTITSHIIPVWACGELFKNKKITKEICENLCESGNNALRLTSILDNLFDKGYLTFSDDGVLIISKEISSFNKNIIMTVDRTLIMNEKLKISLYFHRKYIFRDDKKNISDITKEEINMLSHII